MSIRVIIQHPNGGPVYTVTHEVTPQIVQHTARAIDLLGYQLEQSRAQHRERGYYNEDRQHYDYPHYEHHDAIVRGPPDYNPHQGEEVNRRHRDSRSRSPARNDNDAHDRHAFDRVDWPALQRGARRVLDSCYVQHAIGNEQLAHPDDLMVAVGPAGNATHKFIIKRYTPLRRIVNAYTGLTGQDPKFFGLQWQGRRVGWGEDDTADKVKYLAQLASHSINVQGALLTPLQYRISHGDELEIVVRWFVGNRKLLDEYGQAEHSERPSEEENDVEIKSESTGSSMDVTDDQVSP